MVESIVKDSGRVLPAAAWLNGQYGIDGMFIGVPVRLGRNGVEEILEVELNEAETELMKKSAEHVRSNLDALERLQTA